MDRLNKCLWPQLTAATGTSSEWTRFSDQPFPISGSPMKQSFMSFLLALAVSAAMAQPVRWTKYSISETGTSVDLPASIFTENAGRPDGYGQRFVTSDGRANLTVQSVRNTEGDTPVTFLAKKHPPRNIQYKRIAPRFFAVSSYKDDKVWYDRCNFSQCFIHCVLINYPAREEHDWDDIVTRISLSLSGE
jgi:hypothetical protein